MNYINLSSESKPSTQLLKREQLAEPVQPHLSQSKILQAIETFSIGLIQLDFSWKVRYWNLAAERLTGYKQAEVLNKNLFEVITEMNHIEFYRTWQNNLKTRKPVQFRDYFWPTQKWFEFFAYSSGEDIIVHFQDITKKFAIRKTLSKKIHQLKEVSMFNSHAIRKPLANLIGLTNLLNEDIKLSDFNEYVLYIRKSAKHLDEIVRKINSIANDRADNDHILSMEHFHFKKLLADLREEIIQGNPGKCRLILSCSNVLFYGNKEAIRTSIKVLALHAIKHSGIDQEIKISICVKDSNLYIRVRDYGEGMTAESLANIHRSLINEKTVLEEKEFQRISRLCFQHNGSFWMESKANKGCSRFMLLPLSNLSIFRPGYVKKLLTDTTCKVTIRFDSVHKCLHVKWTGYFDNANLKKGFYKIYDAMRTYQCRKVISDETAAEGSGINCIKWLIKHGFPLLDKADLFHFAWITPKNEFARLSAVHVSKALINNVVIKIFAEHKPAMKWISEKYKSKC